MMIVPTLCVGTPPRTLRVRSGMWRRCVARLQRYPHHALGLLNPQSVPFVTRSVTGGIPTQSVRNDHLKLIGDADGSVISARPQTGEIGNSRLWAVLR
ncbi:hypothetical protein AB7M18_003447 [Pseudomonas viridiflava]